MKRKFGLFFMCVLFVLSSLLLVVGCGGDETNPDDTGDRVTLTFEPNEGTMEQRTYQVEAGASFTMPEPSRDGYAFEGWYLSDDPDGDAAPSTVTPERDTSYFAKWAKLYQLRLDVGDGTLSTQSLSLKEGAGILAAVGQYVPTLQDHAFGEWLLSGNTVTETTRMPAADITLVAHYKVACTVKTYYEDMEGAFIDGKTVTEYAYEGVVYQPAVTMEGFTLAPAHEGSVTSLTVSATPSNNLFTLYFSRNQYNVIFFANYPTGTAEQAETHSERYLYETVIEAPNYFEEPKGYCFLGWSTTATGGVDYHIDTVSERLYGGGEVAPSDDITVKGELMLYGVWAKGAIDLFRGADFIYIFPEEPDAVYLQRENFFFKGEYNKTSGEFYFTDEADDILLKGKFLSEGVFSFSSDARQDLSPALYDGEGNVNSDVRLFFDEYNGVTYNNDGVLSEGTYDVDAEGNIVASFESGEMQDEVHIYRLGSLTTTAGLVSIFMERNDEEYSYQELLYAVVNGAGQIGYYMFYLTFDGFGTCSLTMPNSDPTYYYYRKNSVPNVYDLLYADGSVYMSVLVDVEGNIPCFWDYDGDYRRTYTILIDTLTLDGSHTAVYHQGDKTYEGYYSLGASEFGELLRLFSGEDVFTFLLSEEEIYAGFTVFVATPVSNTYGEFRYSNGESIYNTLFLVFGEREEDSMSLYGYTSAGTFALVSTGTYTFDEETLLYTYTAKEYKENVEVSTNPYDPSEIASMTFSVGTVTTSRAVRTVFFLSELTLKGQEPQGFATVYHSAENEEEKLTLYEGIAVYEIAEGSVSGSYRDYEGFENYIVLYVGTQEGTLSIYFELDNETHTFTLLEGWIGSFAAVDDNGSPSKEGDTLVFDGKGENATFTEAAVGDGEPTVHEGKYRDTNRTTDAGAEIYEFYEGSFSFTYILLTTSSNRYFARYSETYSGEFRESGKAAKLVLDGYGYHARYTTESDNEFEGQYSVEGNVLTLRLDGGAVIVFDLGSNKSFTVRGGEAGDYYVVDNQERLSVYYRLDGYGKLTVFTYDENNQEVVIDANGTYERGTGDQLSHYTFHYTDNGVKLDPTAASGYVIINNVRRLCMIVEHSEATRSYVNEKDLSVLVLDGYGEAVRYGTDGSVERGFYTLITDSLLYYTNGEADDYTGYIYTYDVTKGTATGVQFKNVGYYTQNLESILFSRYGIMTYDRTSYYYYVENNSATIYRKYDAARDGDREPNEYGFISEVFGELNTTGEKHYDGKTYYPTTGYAIQFTREESNKEKYPISVIGTSGIEKRNFSKLTFAPTGSGTFAVSGTLVLGEGTGSTTVNCTVYRTVNEDGTASLYFTVAGTRSDFRYDIIVNYAGDLLEGPNPENTFTVSAMRTEFVMRSEMYMYACILYMAFLGAIPVDTYGTLTAVSEYGEDGEPKEDGRYIIAKLGEDSDMYDAKGNIVSFARLPYEYDEESTIYTVHIPKENADDEYEYNLYFMMTSGFVGYGSYTYRIVAFTRSQTLTSTDNSYTLEIERIITSDYYTAGSAYGMPVLKTADGTAVEIDSSNAWRIGTTRLYFIDRTADESGKNLSATYYMMTLTEDNEIYEENEIPGQPPFTGFEISVKTATTHYAANGKDFADISADGQVLMVYIAAEEEGGRATVYLPTATVYDEETGVYKATVSSTVEYHVTLDKDGVATLEYVEVEPEPAPEPAPETGNDDNG